MTEQTSQQIEDNISRRQAICVEIESLLESPDRGVAEKRVKELEQVWNGLAAVPENELAPLNEKLQELMGRFRGPQKSFHDEKEWEFWANKTLKDELCKLVIGLDQDEDMGRVVATIKKAQIKWKKIGPVPRSASKKMWNKFHEACQRNFERCQPYLDELKKQRQENSQRQEEICRLAEEHAESTDWEASAAALIALQAEWKKMAATQHRKEQRLFKRFRTSCNTFFERREVHLRELDEQRQGNLAVKERLCEQLEILAGEPNADNMKKLRELQADWKKAGPVPRGQDKKIWRRFRKACDSYYGGLDAQLQENLQQKEQLCVEMEAVVAGLGGEVNMTEMAEKVAALQQQWQATGSVPRDREDKILQRFNKLIGVLDAARRRKHDEDDELRQALLVKKQELLDRIEALAEADDPDGAGELSQLQEQWQELGPVARASNVELEKRYQAACACLLEGQRQDFTAMRVLRQENLRKKESLCFLAGKIAGLSPVAEEDDYKTLSLADELKLALAMNSLFSGASDIKALRNEEIERLQREWKKIGPVTAEEDKRLTKRFRRALDGFYGQGQ